VSTPAPASPLSGIKVLDFSQAMAGPFCAQKLGDLGAEVIKVEPTGDGEWHRTRPAADAWVNRHNSSFLAFNRNKRSLAINLKDPASRSVIRPLVEQADVVLSNYRPGVAERLGIDYPTVNPWNSQLIYCSISGYGSSGPYAKRPGQDLLLQGYSGSLFSTGRLGDPPRPMSMFVADATAAHLATQAILGGLLWRERGGQGQLVEVNMLEGMIDMQAQELAVFLTAGIRPERTDEPLAHALLTAPYGIYATADGFMTVSIGPIDLLGDVLDDDYLRSHKSWGEGMTHRDEIFRQVAKILPSRTTAEWLEAFDAVGYWAGPVYDYDDLLADPQVAHNGTFIELQHPTEGTLRLPGIPLRYSKSPGSIRRHQPAVGEHSIEILTELGISSASVGALIESGVIAVDDEAGA